MRPWPSEAVKSGKDPTLEPDRTARDPLLTVAQAGEYLGTGERFVRRLITERRIPYVKLGKYVRLQRSLLDAFVDAGASTACSETSGPAARRASVLLMAKRAAFGTVDRLPGGRYRARYVCPDGSSPNPCRLRSAGSPEAARPSRALTATEAQDLADHLGTDRRTERSRTPVLVLAFGGLRFREATALLRSDVLDGGRLRVERSVRFVAGR